MPVKNGIGRTDTIRRHREKGTCLCRSGAASRKARRLKRQEAASDPPQDALARCPDSRPKRSTGRMIPVSLLSRA